MSNQQSKSRERDAWPDRQKGRKDTQSNLNSSYFLPKKIAATVAAYIHQCKNPALILDKYVLGEVIEDTSKKGTWLQKFGSEYAIDINLVESAYQRWWAMMKALNITPFNITLEWRMVVGLGGETVLETDITLHHLYGTPFIPGSALKGLTRAYAIDEKEEEYFTPLDKPESERGPSQKEDTDHPDIKRMFGTQEGSGTVIFFDAVPVNGTFSFVVDIMNPHYPDYYNSLQGGRIVAPTNDQSPKPIPFLAIKDVTFAFALAPRNPNDLQHKKDVERAKPLLLQALQKYGVGGKTSAGYGYFTKDIRDEPTSISSLEVSHTVSTPVSTSSSVQQQEPAERIRPNIPTFRVGQDIKGNVIAATDEIRQRVPEGATAFLSYESFPNRDLLIVISTEEAKNWKPGETRICLFDHEQVRNDCTLLICHPRPRTRDKKKGK